MRAAPATASGQREGPYRRRRYRAILAATGTILVLAGVVMLLPLAALVAHPEELGHWPAFGVPAAALILTGLAARRLERAAAPVPLTTQEGGVIVLLSWAAVCAVSAVPLALVLDLSFPLALFEAVSGWTTTGLSVVDVAAAGPLVLLWRSTMQLAGGAGLAVIAMSAIVGPTGAGVVAAEGRSDQLAPHVRRSARLVLLIYGAYVAVGIAAYRLAGMGWFDAVNHTFAAVSTGGFSTRVASIGHWDSVAVEAVTLALMVLGSLSFVTAWSLWRGRLGSVARNGEVRLTAVVMPLAAAALLLLTCRGLYPQLGKAARVALFEAVSALTTSGFSTVSYAAWNPVGLCVLVLLMLIGGGACSTAGGLKQHRVFLLGKLVVWELRRALLPPAAILERPLWQGDTRVFVDDGRLRELTTFVTLYGALYAAGIAVLCACGFPLAASVFEAASALGTVGLSVGVTAATMPAPALWALTVAMFLGRLEIVVVVVGVVRIAADLRRMLPVGTARATPTGAGYRPC